MRFRVSKGEFVRALPLVCLVLLAAVVSVKSVRSPDLWWHLASGNWMVENGAILDRDVFTFSSPQIPWINRTWLSAILFFLAWKAGGLFAVVLIPFALVTGFFVTMVVAGRAARHPVTFALLGLLVLAVAHIRILERPFLFSDLLAPAVILLWLRVRAGRGGWGTLAGIVSIQVLWTHLHGGFVLGLLVAGVFALGSLVRGRNGRTGRERWLPSLVLAACLGAAFLTPWQGDLIENLGGFVSRLAPALTGDAQVAVPEVARDSGVEAERNIVVEWLPTFSGPGMKTLMPIFPFVVLLYGVVIWQLVGIVRCGRLRERMEEALLLVAFAVLGAVSIRFPATLAWAAFPLLWELWAPRDGGGPGTPAAKEAKPSRADRRRAGKAKGTPAFFPAWAGGVLSAGMLLMSGLVVSNVYWRTFNSPSEFGVQPRPYLFPEKLADWMDENRLQGRFFNIYDAGGYLSWRRQGVPIFTDSRLVSNEVYGDYLKALDSREGWESVSAKYDFEGALMRRNDRGREERLYRALKEDPRWVQAYEDARWACFLTRDYLERLRVEGAEEPGGS